MTMESNFSRRMAISCRMKSNAPLKRSCNARSIARPPDSWGKRAGSMTRLAVTSNSAKAPFRPSVICMASDWWSIARMARHVFHELGAEVIALGVQPDGFNINEGCGAIAPEMLAQAVREHRADFGIALDGDADRVQMADGAARLYNGDELLYVLAANWISARGQIAGVVGTWMTNLAVEIALKALGLEFERAAVGDRYVLEKLRERNWPLGGEGSGHIVSLDHHTTGDGIISALLVLAALKRRGRTLAEILQDVQLLPQKLVNAPLPPGLDWRHSASLHSAVDQARAALGEEGRVLIRASGTEPVLRIMVEAADMRTAARIAQSIAAAI